MAKISSYVDGGNPQNTDEFVVARVGLNLKITWANILSVLSAAYASIASGVTNGDSHDHSGGDGGTVSHLALSNIGTYTHAEIDTFISSDRWTSLFKDAAESKASDTSVAADSVLKVTLLANAKYAFRGRVFFDTVAAADFKYRLNCIDDTEFYAKHTSYPAGSSTGTTTVDTTTPGTTVAVTGAGTVGGYVEFDGIVSMGVTGGILSFQWAQNTSTASNTTVKPGSYLQYMRVS